MYAKAIIGALVAALGALTAGLADGTLTAIEGIATLSAGLAALGAVDVVPNAVPEEPREVYVVPTTPPDQSDAGQAGLDTLLLVAILIGVVLLLFGVTLDR